MSEQPNINRPAEQPHPEDADGWHTPSAAEEQSPPEGTAGQSAPDMPLWHAPQQGESTPLAESPEPEAAAAPPPEGWHEPTLAAADYGSMAEEPGGWHAPVGAGAGELLSGLDATVYPLPAEPEPEVIPVDEETTAVLTPELEEAEAEEDTEPEAVTEEVPILGTEEERQLFESEDAASIAAAMARRLERELEERRAAEASRPLEEPEEEEEPEPEAEEAAPEADSPAAIAAARVAELTRQRTMPEETVVEEPAPAADTPLARLAGQFDQVEEKVHRLRDLYHQGRISRDALQDELRKLMILDEQGNWWMLGTESDIWYRYENGQWVPAQRPRLPRVDYGGTDALLAQEMAAQEPTVSIRLDEDNMPIVERAPTVDPEATMVGEAAVRFDQLPTEQATIPGPAARRAAAADAGPSVPRASMQPDYTTAYDPRRSELYRRVQEQEARRTRNWVLRAVVAVAFGGLGLALLLIVGAVLFYVSRVNLYSARIDELANIASQFETTRIYDVNGNLLTQINDPTGGTRISVPLQDISPFLIHATISVENERFYQDPGWDPIAITRAIIQNLQEGAVVTGASTITQQLARALVIDPERRAEVSLSRKIDEVIIAAEIGRRYTKNQILELYLNEIYYGNLAYGAEAAAQTYFNISARDLNLPQAALLAGLVQAPATYDPVINREAAFARMDSVIDLMLQAGCLQFQHEPFVNQGPFCVTEEDVQRAVVQRAEVEIREYTLPVRQMRYPHFVNYVAQQLEENYGLADIYRTGFNVFTTLEPNLQEAVQAAVNEQLASLRARGIGGNNASVVVMDPRDGRIRAMVGSADYYSQEIDGQVNVAFTPQQPGSSIKPLVYLAAFQGNPAGQYWTPATIIWDTPTCWGGYCPTNYDGTFHGPHSARSALANSYNIPAVKTMEFVTPDRFAQVAQAVGLTFPGSTPQQAGLPGAIGAFDVRLYDMVVAYGVLANGGRRVTPYTITRITDNQGNEVPLPTRPEPVQVVQPEHAYLVTHILSDDVARGQAFGRGTVLNIPGYTAAVKTGTTNDNRDNWTLGYTPTVVVGVWHGNTDNAPMRGTSGFIAAAPIWNRVMQAALAGQPPTEFPVPPGITTLTICADSGTLPSELCLNRRQELFVQAQPPPGPEQDIYQLVRIDTLTGLRANDFCPRFTEERLFLNISDPTAFNWINNTQAGQNWAAQRNIPLPAQPPPADSCNPNIQQPIIEIDFPVPNAEIQGLVEIRGRVLVYNFNRYQLEYGVGADPEAFGLVDGPYTIQHSTSELLGRWDVSQLPNGPYTLRLHVVTNDGGFADLDVPVLVNNPLPTDTPSPTAIIVTQTPTPSWTPLIPVTPATATPTATTPPVVITLTPTPPPVASALPPRDPSLDIPVVYGAVATNFINDSQLAVYYRFDGQAGDQIQVAAQNTAGDLDTLVYLMDAAGNILAEDDDSGEGTDSLLNYTLPVAGTYVIAVTRFDVSSGFSSGEFRMTLTKLN